MAKLPTKKQVYSKSIKSTLGPKGSIHSALKVKQGDKIPTSKLNKAAKGKGAMAAKARLLLNLARSRKNKK